MNRVLFQQAGVDVWVGVLDCAAPDISLLSADERERAARYRFEEDRRRFVSARTSLRNILASYTGCHPAQISFRRGLNQKPSLDGEHSRIRFSASHSRNLFLVAVAHDRHVGADVEFIRADIDCDALANNYFAPKIAAEVAEAPASQKPELFFEHWTSFEARQKLFGAGLTGPTVASRDTTEFRFSPGIGYTAAVALHASEEQVP
jgi:4'-phosphopantetheinyl transferase